MAHGCGLGARCVGECVYICCSFVLVHTVLLFGGHCVVVGAILLVVQGSASVIACALSVRLCAHLRVQRESRVIVRGVCGCGSARMCDGAACRAQTCTAARLRVSLFSQRVRARSASYGGGGVHRSRDAPLPGRVPAPCCRRECRCVHASAAARAAAAATARQCPRAHTRPRIHPQRRTSRGSPRPRRARASTRRCPWRATSQT